MRSIASIMLTVAACVAFIFAAFSTHDFVAHLDRQVHGIHCSFLPGIAAADPASTGCQVTLMSPYSSVFRSSLWGGLPVALPAMGVFAFLAFWGLWLRMSGRAGDRRATGFTLLATALPVLASVVMGYLALHELDAACKLCIGIYVASAVCFGAAVVLHLSADVGPAAVGESLGWSTLGTAFAIGVAFVAIPSATYAMQAPDFSHYVGTCGELQTGADPRVPIPLGPQDAALRLLEVIDPLCPSCAGFEKRLSRLPARHEVARTAVLFPLDSSCNWMVDESIHPGACAVSEAVVCAEARAEEVLEWSFAQRDAIMAAEQAGEGGAAAMVEARFPELSACVGSSKARARVNLALRWAIDNRLRVLTPQVYVEGLRLCDEDTDLGLDYALPRLIARVRNLGDDAPARKLKAPEPESIARAVQAVRHPTRAAPAPAAGGGAQASAGAEESTQADSADPSVPDASAARVTAPAADGEATPQAATEDEDEAPELPLREAEAPPSAPAPLPEPQDPPPATTPVAPAAPGPAAPAEESEEAP